MVDQQHVSYRIFSFFGRDVFAVPASSRRLRLAGIKRYQPYTLKRAAYRQFIRAAIYTGIDRFFSRSAPVPVTSVPAFDYNRLISELKDQLDVPELTGVVYWPPQLDRGRIYVHLFDADASPVGFAKVSFDAENNHLLNQAGEALRLFNAAGLKTCHVPRLLRCGQFEGYTYLVTEPIPISAKPVKSVLESFPRRSVDEIIGSVRRVGPRDLDSLSWWPAYKKVVGRASQVFDDELTGLLEDGLEVGRAHGDMGAGNLVREGDTLWLYDWENFREDAPMMTDEVGFYMAIHFVAVLSDPITELRRFHAHFLRGATRAQRGRVMAGLAFRAASGLQDVVLFFRHWQQLEAPAR